MTDIVRGNIEDVKSALLSCAFVVTDTNVKALYPELCAGAFIIAPGEKSKTPETLFSILSAMCEKKIARGDRIGALGGGVIGDVTGLAAALYMRGIEWINIPTTLLSLADSGMGGKTGINFLGEKNIIGAFHFSTRTILSYDFIDTLPPRERLCGIGEIVKTCLLTKDACKKLFDSADKLKEFSREHIDGFIDACVKIKSEVVRRDPAESGLRRVLNAGHTVGHALESADNWTLSHGEYVLKGLAAEIAMFPELVDKGFAAEVLRVVRMFTTPPKTTAGSVLRYAERDKKNADNNFITVMLPTAPGEVSAVEANRDEFVSRYERAIKDLKAVWEA